ncbi:MAG: FecR domain-containing protein [bacterium]
MLKRISISAIAVIFIAATAGTIHCAAIKATISKIKGDVQVKIMADMQWKAATDGMKVGEGAEIKAGENSEAFLTWSKGNIVKILPLTAMKIESLQEDEKKTSSNLTLASGNLFARVAKLKSSDSSFKIKTPTALAGVRGTAFDVTPSNIAVVEGTIVVEAGGQEIEVTEGMMVAIEIGMPPSLPEAIPPEKMEGLEAVNTECEEVAAEIVEAAAPPAREEEKPADVEIADEVVDQNVDQTTVQNQSVIEIIESTEFEPGTGGINGTLSY